MNIRNLSAVFYTFNPPEIKIISCFLVIIPQLVAAFIRTLNFTYTMYLNFFNIQSLYQLLIWKPRLWNSEMDVESRWLYAPVAFCSDVRQYVDIRVLQGLLQNNVQNKWQIEFIEFSWQQSSKVLFKLKTIFITNSFVKLLYIYIYIANKVCPSNGTALCWHLVEASFIKDYCCHLLTMSRLLETSLWNMQTAWLFLRSTERYEGYIYIYIYTLTLFPSYRSVLLRNNHAVCMFQRAVLTNLDMINRWQQ